MPSVSKATPRYGVVNHCPPPSYLSVNCNVSRYYLPTFQNAGPRAPGFEIKASYVRHSRDTTFHSSASCKTAFPQGLRGKAWRKRALSYLDSLVGLSVNDVIQGTETTRSA